MPHNQSRAIDKAGKATAPFFVRPIRREALEGTEYDFRQPKRIGSIKLDHAFTDLEWDADGLARVELAAHQEGH
jgi:aldose 1-epimerase